MTTPDARDALGGVLLRAASADDFEAVVVLELEIFGRDAWSPRALDAEFTGLGSTRSIAVAESAGQVCGYGVLMFAGDEAGVADVLRVAVRASHRGHGIATQLLDRLLDEADRRRCGRVLLEVAADNESALALYAAMGFAEIARRPRYYRSEIDAVIMELSLPGPGANVGEDS